MNEKCKNNPRMEERNKGIDLYRLIFAFFVVVLHVELKGAILLYPFLRSAVPFFFILSGYFLYSSNSISFVSKIKKNIKKWIKMYVIFFILVSVFSIGLHYYLNQEIELIPIDIIRDFVTYEAPENLNIIYINTKSYGLYTTWFLLAGAYAFIVLYIVKDFVYNKYFLLTLIACYIMGVIQEFYDFKIFPKPLTTALPLLVIGIWIKKYEDRLINLINLPIIISVVLLAYADFILVYFYKGLFEQYLLTPPS